MERIFLYTMIIVILIFVIIGLCYNEEYDEEEIEEQEEREQCYLKLQNMTTQEILLFKRKEDFIKDVGCYDILREFYNDSQIIDRVYPNYKRLD